MEGLIQYIGYQMERIERSLGVNEDHNGGLSRCMRREAETIYMTAIIKGGEN